MWMWAMGLFLVAHGLVHLAVWVAPPKAEGQPFDPYHSWALEGAGIHAPAVHTTASVMAVIAAAAFVFAGVALLAGGEIWRPMTIGASVLGLAMAVLWFHPWFLFDVAINAGLLLGLTVWDWPSKAMVGS